MSGSSSTPVSTASPVKRVATRFVSWIIVTAALSAALGVMVEPGKFGTDYFQFYVAATLLANGESPYDVEGQIEVSRELGWDRETTGKGKYDFMPYYYPPWVGMAVLWMLPLAFSTAQYVWVVLILEAAAVAGWLAVKGNESRLMTAMLFVLFGLSVIAIKIGQVAPLILLLTAILLRLLEDKKDYWAGFVLAALAFKPQVAVVIVPAVLVWSGRQRRWPVWIGSAATMIVLAGISFAMLPDWPRQMFAAPNVTPLVTTKEPGHGVAAMNVIQSPDLHKNLRAVLYAAIIIITATPCFAARASASEIVCRALLAAFWCAPYARFYDLPILLIPYLHFSRTRLSAAGRAVGMLVILVGPYIHGMWVPFEHWLAREVMWFWVVLFVTGVGLLKQKEEPVNEPCPEN